MRESRVLWARLHGISRIASTTKIKGDETRLEFAVALQLNEPVAQSDNAVSDPHGFSHTRRDHPVRYVDIPDLRRALRLIGIEERFGLANVG